jgi:hypothetical protein
MSANPQQLSNETAIPIIIGVTGHRDLRPADIPQLQARVGQIIRELLEKYPNTPLLVLSPLAEGADRLVAKVALHQGARLAVPLPLPSCEYERDFSTAESKKEFQTLLKQAWKCFELPLVHGNTLASVKEYGPARDKQYALVGAYVAQHSHILIALWDGTHADLVGGTGQIVDFKLKGIPEPYAVEREPLDIIDNGPVYHILTPRAKNPAPEGTAFNLEIKFPEGWESGEGLEKSFGRILKQMDTFNYDAQRLSNRLATEVQKNRGYVIPEPELPALSVGARFILDQYAVADTLALHFQKRRKWTLITLFVIAVVAVLSFEVYAHLLSKPLVLMLYPLALLSAVCFYALAKWKAYQNKHLDYRALAEGLRVQLFWNLAGMSEDVAEHYLRQHRTELDWIRNAIRAWNVVARDTCDPKLPAEQKLDEAFSRKMIELVIEHWVEDQRKFFERTRKRDHDKLKKYERRAKGLFIFGLGLAILVVGWHFLSPEFAEHSHGRHWLIVIMGITPAIAAALGGYAEKMAYSAQAKSYDWMTSLFNRAAKQVNNLITGATTQAINTDGSNADLNKLAKPNYSPVQRLFLDLGSEALEENGDWVMIHRERTADVYKGT